MMNYEEREEKFKDISKDIHKDLKPIFDRLVDKQTDFWNEQNSTDWDEYIPPCGITERNSDLTEEQIKDLDEVVDQTVSEVMDNPADYDEIRGQVPASEKGQAGQGRGDSHGRVKLAPMEFPEWLEDIESEVKDFYVAKKGRKGLDYEEIIKGVIRKAKQKVIQRDDALYVFIDTSGSMWNYVDQYGTPILKLFSSYFPTIAQKYNGQVWFADYSPLNSPEPISRVVELSDFRSDEMNDLDIGGYGGTEFWGVWQYFQKKEREAKERNPDANIMMVFFSDMEADFYSYPELIAENAIFVTIKGKGQEVKHLIDGDKRKLIFVDAKIPNK